MEAVRFHAAVVAETYSGLAAESRMLIEVVIEAVLDRRARGELRVGPDFEDGGGQNVRSRMAQALDIGHLRTLLQSFSFVRHWRD